MGKRIRSHVRSNVVGYLALFVALGGTATAVTQLDLNSVRSINIVNGQVKRPDIGKNAVNASKVAPKSLKRSDLARGTIPAPDTPAQVLNKLKTVDGSGSGLDADTVGGMPASQLALQGFQVARAGCNVPSSTFVNCLETDFTMPRDGPLLLMFTANVYSDRLDHPDSDLDATNYAASNCRFRVDGAFPSGDFGTLDVLYHADQWHTSSMNELTDLDAGPHHVAVSCREADGNVSIYDAELVVLVVGRPPPP